MKVMIIVKATAATEAGEMPTDAEIAAMGQFNEQLADAGILIAAEGLHDSRKGVRVRFSDKATTLIEGPFPQTGELISGFWIVEVKSMDEAIGWAQKIPFSDGEEVELRRLFEASDWEDAGTAPELIAEEQKLRDRVEKR